MAQKTLSAGQYEAYGYDTRGRATAIALKNSSGTVLRTQSYAYDLSSKITSHTLAGVATSYGYDGAGQLLTEGRTGYSGSYTYDGNGNRLTRSVNGTAETYAYDDGDKLGTVSVGGAPIKTYGYDAAGRTTSVASSAGTTTLAYDYEGRATSIVGPGVSQTNAYNGLDTRVGSTTNSVASTYLRDGASVTDSVLKDGAATYTPGISERRGTTTTFSHSGTTNDDAQSTTAQAVSATRQYDAFGNVSTSTGSFAGSFGYGGKFGYQEDATGLKLLGHRLYDSSTGRFLTRDPIKDGRNWYTYCDNDPVNRVDQLGFGWHDPVIVFVSPDFKGKVWGVGEPGPGKPQSFFPIPGGEFSPKGADVDIIIVQHPNGRQDRYFLPGTNGPQDPTQVTSTYIVASDGTVFALPNPVEYLDYPITTIGPIVRVPLPSIPVFGPRPFGPKPGGGYNPWIFGGTGNWNDDIEAAKRHPYPQ